MGGFNNARVGRGNTRPGQVAMQSSARNETPRCIGHLKGLLLASAAFISAATSFASAETINNTTRTVTTAVTYPDYLFIATTGTGTLTISSGGTVSHPKYGDIGQKAGSSGTVTVTGTGSQWTSGSSITVGDAGVGTLDILQGGVVSDTVGYVGYTKGGSGTVTVDGDGSLWTNSSILYVGGLYGSGSLTIQNGGSVEAGTSSGYTSIGYSSTSEGTVTVTGEGSSLVSHGQLGVGSYGKGTLNVEDGATVSDTQGVIATQAGSTGTATVTGADSSWTNSTYLFVGYSGNGTLNVEDGGTVSNTNYGVIGSNAGSVGTVTVTGAGSSWSSESSMTAGDSGNGTLTIEKGGSVTDTTGYIGYSASGSGSVTVTGADSTWTNNANLFVGRAGMGELDILEGGSVTNIYAAYVGYNAGSTGTATVSGANSSWISSSLIYVGFNGNGTMTVEAGGSVSDTEGRIGQEIGGVGSVKVTGAGSEWTNSSYLTVGYSGAGDLLVEEGGSVTSLDGYIGYKEGSVGTVTVSGAGSEWTSSASILIGDAGEGSLTIEKGGTVSDTVGFVGYEAGEAASGKVVVTGAGSTWTNSAALLVGVYGTGTVVIADGGTIAVGAVLPDTSHDGTVTLASEVGSVGTLVLGAAANASAVAPGTLDAAALEFGPGTGTVVFNHTSDAFIFRPGMSGAGTIDVLAGTTLLTGDSAAFTGSTTIAAGATLSVGNGGTSGRLGGDIVDNGALIFDRSDNLAYAGALSGTGTLTKSGAGVLDLTGTSASFSGATTIAEGQLKVSGSLAGSVVTALDGTTLSGSGTVGGVVAKAGSTIAPGNSPGTLHVAGGYVQEAGSIYAVEVVPGSATSDLVSVAGAATLESGAILNVSKWVDGGYPIDAHYTVLSATGGVSGTYEVTGDTAISAFYDLMATYDEDNVYLDGVQTRSFASAGVTPNQRSVAAGLQTLPGGSDLRFAIGSLQSDAEAQAAFDALSGEVHASIKGAMVENSGITREAAINRLRSAFADSACGKVDTLPVKAPQPAEAACSAVWTQGFGAWGHMGGDGNAARLSNDTGGFLIGADTPALNTWRVGLLGGYSRSTYSVDARTSSGNSDNYTIGAYGGSQWDDVGLRVGAAYTLSEVETQRSVVFPGYADALAASYNTGTTQIFGDIGYTITFGAASFEPFAGLAYVNVNADNFSERGGAAALIGAGDDTGVTFSTLGLRGSTNLAAGSADIAAFATLGWRHAWGDITPTSTFSFAGSESFGVAGTPIAEDAALVEAGITAALSRSISLDVNYSGQFGDGVESQGIHGALTARF